MNELEGIPQTLLQLVFEQLPVGLLVIDREGIIRLYNTIASRLTGHNAVELMNRPLSALFNGPGDAPSNPYTSKLLRTLSTGKEYQSLKPGAVLPVAGPASYTAHTCAIRQNSGAITGAVAIFMPDSWQQELETALIKAEKLAILGQLAAGVVHEIKNPLAALDGFLQLLKKELSGTPKEEYINVMMAELKHVNNLIKDFLSLAKPGSARRVNCRLEELLREVVLLFHSDALLRGIEITMEIAEGVPELFIDKEQIKQVFINIFKNTFEALPGGGNLSVKATWDAAEQEVYIIVEDTGIGMDSNTIASLFNPFFTTKESGTGLGMFISKKIIENHAGRIEVKSEPGKGSRVTVVLPEK